MKITITSGSQDEMHALLDHLRADPYFKDYQFGQPFFRENGYMCHLHHEPARSNPNAIQNLARVTQSKRPIGLVVAEYQQAQAARGLAGETNHLQQKHVLENFEGQKKAFDRWHEEKKYPRNLDRINRNNF